MPSLEVPLSQNRHQSSTDEIQFHPYLLNPILVSFKEKPFSNRYLNWFVQFVHLLRVCLSDCRWFLVSIKTCREETEVLWSSCVCMRALRVGYMVSVGSSYLPAEFARPFVTSELLLLSSAEIHTCTHTHAHTRWHICLRPVSHSDLNKSTLVGNMLTKILLLRNRLYTYVPLSLLLKF